MANQKILRYGTANQWMIVMDGDRGIAPGGFNRQVLTKLSGTDYDAQWRDPAGFTFTQGVAPTVGLDTTSALTTGQTWWDTATGNGYVRVATQWVQFAWGDSEARYVNAVGDTMSGQLTLNGGGGETMELRPGAANHVYIEFFARTANPGSRSAYLGFPAAGTNDFTIANSLPGDIVLSPSTGRVVLNADPTSALHAVTKQYSDLKLLKSGDTMSGILTMNANINMGTGRKIDFTDELGMKLDLYGGSYWLGIASGTLQYASGGSHQFYGQVNTDTHFSAAGSVYANSGRVRMGAWQSAPYAAGWGGLVGSRGYILIDYSDGSGGNMHVRGNNTLYIGGDSGDNMYFYGGVIRSLTSHYFDGGIAVAGGSTVGANGSFGGRSSIGTWDQNGNYSAVMGHYGYHLMGGAGDGAVHTRGNLAGWNHNIGAGNLIVMEQWTYAALGAGSGGTVVQKGDGVLANAASRRALKERIQPLTDTVDAGAIIDALEPITFIWKAPTDKVSQDMAMAHEYRKAIVYDLPANALALAVSSDAVPIPDLIAEHVAVAVEVATARTMAAARTMAVGDVLEEPVSTEPEPTEAEVAALLQEVADRIAEVPEFNLDAAEAWRQADVRLGLVAEDVADVSPQLANWVIEKDEDGNTTGELVPGSWNEQALITVLIQGVQDLRARVAVLEAPEVK